MVGHSQSPSLLLEEAPLIAFGKGIRRLLFRWDCVFDMEEGLWCKVCSKLHVIGISLAISDHHISDLWTSITRVSVAVLLVDQEALDD